MTSKESQAKRGIKDKFRHLFSIRSTSSQSERKASKSIQSPPAQGTCTKDNQSISSNQSNFSIPSVKNPSERQPPDQSQSQFSSTTSFTAQVSAVSSAGSEIASSAIIQVASLSSRPEHLQKLKDILRAKLEKDEYDDIVHDSSSSAREIVESVLGNFKSATQGTVTEVPEAQQRRRQRMDRMLNGIEAAAKIGDVALQHHPDVVALAWAGFRLLLQVAINHRELMNIMESSIDDIIKALGVCGCYEAIYVSVTADSATQLGDSLVELYAAVIIFCIKARKDLEKSSMKTSIIGTFTGLNMKYQAMVEDIRTKEKSLETYANLANTEDQRQRFEELHYLTTEISNNLSDLITEQKLLRAEWETAHEAALTEKQKDDLRQSRLWLGGLDNNLEYERNRKLHSQGTCNWILEHNVFKRWLNGETTTLLMCGIPGAGKSVLQSFILTRLRDGLPLDNPDFRPIILHFFFKNGASKTESPVTMMATLIDQFIQQCKEQQSIDLLISARNNSNSEHCENFRELWTLFMQLVRAEAHENLRPVFVLIDALDECGDAEVRSEFLENIADPKSDWKALRARFLFTTRPEDEVIELLTAEEPRDSYENNCVMLKLETEIITQDITRFIKEQTLTKKYKKLQQFRDQIIKIVPEKSQGMFRYAALMLDQLARPSPDNIDKILHSIPPGLNSMYVWILEHIGNDEYELLLRKTTFMWIAMAFRPVTVYEIALAYAAYNHDIDGSEFEPSKKRLIDEQDILRSCGPMVEITAQNSLAFTHFTVKEFLFKNSPEATKGTPYNSRLVAECLITDFGMAHGAILKACITQLLSSIFLNSLARTERASASIYSVTKWVHHAARSNLHPLSSREAERIPHAQTADPWPAVCKFLSPSNPSFATWRDLIPVYDYSVTGTCLYMSKGRIRTTKPLHVIACFDLRIPLMRTLHTIDSAELDINCKDSEGKSPLTWAVISGHVEVVKILLQNGADIESKDSMYGHIRTPLCWAAQYGHTELVKVLVQNGAEVDVDCEQTPLLLAAENGHVEAVKVLLENGADIEKKDYRYEQTSLSWAAKNNHAEVVEFLLEKDAYTENRDVDHGATPLSFAARHGDIDVVRFLLQHGVDIESRDSEYGQTPLAWAAKRGYHDVVELLLEKGANPDSQDCEFVRKPLTVVGEDGQFGPFYI